MMTFLLGFGLSLHAAPSGDMVKFEVTNAQTAKGVVRCALYTSKENWLGDKPFRSVKAGIEQGKAVCTFRNIKPGNYAIAALHDEDRDQEMDTTLGIPNEEYAMSKNAHQDELKPDWDDAQFAFWGGVLRLEGELTD